jgi:hypothetical protein
MDSTVLIGFCFKDDIWFSQSGFEFNSAKKKYISGRVQREFDINFKKIMGIVRNVLLRFNDEVWKLNSDDIDGKKVNQILEMLKVYDSRFELVDFIREMASKHSKKDTLIKHILTALDEYRRVAFQRNGLLSNAITSTEIECWLRLSAIDRYEDIHSSLLSSGISNLDDIEILLDAHDLCCNNSHEIDFVTGDFHDIKKYEPEILSATKIHSIIFLGDT